MNSTSSPTSSHRPYQPSSASSLPSDSTRIYAAVDMKSYYASVECVYRDLDPLKANLLVADEERSDATICLAVSPSLKAKGVPGRPRLFEAKQAIKLWEAMLEVRAKYGSNALFTGKNMVEGATSLERNMQIGGHRA